MDVDILTGPVGVAGQGTLDDKAEFLIEAHGGLVIGIDFQFKAQQVQPLIRHIHGCLHESCADAFSLEIIPDRHADLARVLAARVIISVDIQLTDQRGNARARKGRNLFHLFHLFPDLPGYLGITPPPPRRVGGFFDINSVT